MLGILIWNSNLLCPSIFSILYSILMQLFTAWSKRLSGKWEFNSKSQKSFLKTMVYKRKRFIKKWNSTSHKNNKAMGTSENSKTGYRFGAPTWPIFFPVSSEITVDSEHKLWLDHSYFSKYKWWYLDINFCSVSSNTSDPYDLLW